MSINIVFTSNQALAGDKLTGYIQLPRNCDKPQSIELRLSCSFCGGTLVNPLMSVKRMNAASFAMNANNQVAFEYSLPSDLPASSVRLIGGVNQGVTYTLTARVIRSGLFSRSLYATAVAKIIRNDPGTGLKVKCVKMGGQPMREMLAKPVDCC